MQRCRWVRPFAMPLARTIITVRRPPPHTQPFYTESPPHVARLQPRSPHCSLLVRHIHSSRLHSEDGKKQSASAASSSSTDSDTTQYWRAERIFDRIRQEQEAEHDNNGSDSNKETTKKKKVGHTTHYAQPRSDSVCSNPDTCSHSQPPAAVPLSSPSRRCTSVWAIGYSAHCSPPPLHPST